MSSFVVDTDDGDVLQPVTDATATTIQASFFMPSRYRSATGTGSP
jgi:hypothetical protein